MTIYTVRQSFTLLLDGVIYLGGESVDLNDIQFEKNKHKLEGVDSNPIAFQGGNNNSDSNFPAPHFKGVTPSVIFDNRTVELTINGSFFTPNITVGFDQNIVVNSLEFVSDNQLKVSITTSSVGFASLLLDRDGLFATTNNALKVISFADSVVDLRAGGSIFSNAAIEMHPDMSFGRSNNGLYFTGRSPNLSWARFVGDNNAWVWNRSEKKTLAWIFTNNRKTFLGIGSRNNDPNATSQQFGAEVLAEFLYTSLEGFSGNTGVPGNGINYPTFVYIEPNAVKKIVFEQNGEVGSKFSLYSLPSSEKSDWADTSNLLASKTIDSGLLGSSTEIMPFVIPVDSNVFSLFLGFYIY